MRNFLKKDSRDKLQKIFHYGIFTLSMIMSLVCDHDSLTMYWWCEFKRFKRRMGDFVTVNFKYAVFGHNGC